MNTLPTLYTEINALLELLLLKQQAILGDALVGLYLFGSLATGDFTSESSDIDFIAALATELDEVAVTQLQRMHEEIAPAICHCERSNSVTDIIRAALKPREPANNDRVRMLA